MKQLKQRGSETLKERMPRGAVQVIADKLGFSWVWTNKVISGKENGDPRIINLAIEFAKKENQRREQLERIMKENTAELQKME